MPPENPPACAEASAGRPLGELSGEKNIFVGMIKGVLKWNLLPII
jgi:hypothetical protein